MKKFQSYLKFCLPVFIVLCAGKGFSLEPDLNLQNLTVTAAQSPAYYRAGNSITAESNVIIESGADAVFEAGGTIRLTGNFTAADGSRFRASTIVIPPPVITSFNADTTSIIEGETVTLSWNVSDAYTCTASDGWSGTKIIPGTEVMTPILDTTYTLTCTGPSGTDTKNVSITVLADSTPPSVTGITPVDGSILNADTPTIAASFSDDISGVNAASIVILLDTIDVTVQVAPTSTGFSFTPPVPLPDGNHSLSIFVNDITGNSANAVINFTTDTSLPIISNVIPVDGSLLANNMPAMSGSFSDIGSGIDAATAQIFLNGADITASAIVTILGFSYTPVLALAESSHTLSVSVNDIAGNNASASVSFTVDAIPPPPVLTFIADTLSIINGATVTLSWSTTNADTCTASNGWSGAKAVTGTQAVTPIIDTTYTLTCDGAGGSDVQSVAITVSGSYSTIIDYTYDDLNQLKTVIEGSNVTTYDYDEVGNILQKNVN